MADVKSKFVVTLNIKKENEEHGHVYYKQDGERFDYSCTIKMNVETRYEFTLTMRPQQTLEFASVNGSPVSLVPGEMKDNSSSYKFQWFTAGVCVTKKKLRDAIPLVLNVRDAGTLTIILQIKFYKAGDLGHSTWGNALHHIDYECTVESSKSYIDIAKEVYR